MLAEAGSVADYRYPDSVGTFSFKSVWLKHGAQLSVWSRSLYRNLHARLCPFASATAPLSGCSALLEPTGPDTLLWFASVLRASIAQGAAQASIGYHHKLRDGEDS